jgi:N,N'-diacetyllegionaminate synthase
MKTEMRIGPIDTNETVLLVAEIGNNHEGEIKVAKELVVRAAEAGAHAVKFQTYKTERFMGSADAARFERMKRFELTYDQFAELAKDARANGLLFMSTPLDMQSADFLTGIVDAFKIASGDNTFFPLIARVARTGKPMIVAAGLSELDEVKQTVEFVRSQPGASDELAVLHCVSAYPAPPEQVNLRAIATLDSTLDCTVGYSDHTIGIDAATLAVGLGARVIEKHFTLDHNFSEFRDHQLSANPEELTELARRLREAEKLVGESGKHVQPAEDEGRITMRRSIVASRDLPAGTVLAEEDVMWIRPGGGLAPGKESVLLGRRLLQPLAFAEPFDPANVE